MERALGWRIDPYVRHELRYFVDGEPTCWVSTGGKIALETVAPVHEYVAAGVGAPGPAPASPAPAPASAGPAPAPPSSFFEPTTDAAGDAWRMDPLGTHEFRYFEGGLPTAWVSTEGVVPRNSW